MTLHLTRLSLRNVRSYESAELEFGPGVTVLVGDVGSGKTSLFHAIEMALFGFAEVEAPYLVRHRSGSASVALTLSDGEHSYELARTFRRKTRRGREVFEPEEPSFRVDGELRTYSATEFRQRVIELLGFPDNPNPRSRSDLWRWAVYTPQERMREILREDEAEARLETIRKALGLERYRLAADNAEVLATALRARSRTHAEVARGLQHFETDLAKAETDLATSATAQSEAEANSAEARRRAAEAEELLTASEAGRRAREADQRELEHRTQEQARLEVSISTGERRAAEAVAEVARNEHSVLALDGLRPQRVESQHVLEAAERGVQAAKAQMEGLDAASKVLAAAEAVVRAVRSSLEDHERGLLRDQEELLRARREAEAASQSGPVKEPPAPTPRSVEEIVASIAALRAEETSDSRESHLRDAELHELSELIDGRVCPRCHQTVRPEEFSAHRTEAEQAAAAASARLRAVQERVVAAEAERSSRERFERAHQSWSSKQELRERAQAAELRARERVATGESALEGRKVRLASSEESEAASRVVMEPLRAARAELDLAESQREVARAAVAGIEQRLATAEALQESLRSARAHADGEAARLAEERRRLAEVRTALEVLRNALRGVAEANRAHAELLAQRDSARREERSTGEAVTSARERRSFAEERRNVAATGVAERRTHLERSEHLQALAGFVTPAFRDALLDLERRLLGRAQATFERSFSHAFSTLVEDPGLLARCGPSFVPFVEIDGEWTPAEALSGGERTALALAFRVALGDVVRNSGRLRLDTILLDEPTDGFSPEQVARMGELLRSLPWGQVLVVTHETSLAGVADRTVRVRKDGGLSHLEGEVASTTPPIPSVTPTRRRKPTRVDEPAPPAT
ncbi:MAG: SMC family ATPase [Thermoplasmata archaeon]|nr:SMC family ATPase [Thermoplasmata archaeon]